MALTIRRARMEDIDALIDLGKRGHADSEHAQYPFDEPRARLLAAAATTGGKMCLFLAEDEGKIGGLLVGTSERYPHAKMTYATDLAIFSEMPGAGRKLIERFKVWALEERKVDEIILAVSHGGKSAQQTQSLYRRLGFQHMGGLFTMQRGEK